MKNLKMITPCVIVAISFYLLGSFCNVSFNLSNWCIASRYFFGIMGFIFVFMAYLWEVVKNIDE